jgi:hypothetical protein
MSTSTVPLGISQDSKHEDTLLTWKRLLWKEWKQIQPLLIALIGIAALLHLLGALTRPYSWTVSSGGWPDAD